MANTNSGMQWQQGVMIGKRSVLDTPQWLDIDPVPDYGSSGSSDRIDPKRRAYAFTRLTRLKGLVRTVRESPTNYSVAHKAFKLAKELLGLDWDVR